MPNIVNLWAESQANIIGDDAQPTLTLTNSSTGAGLQVDTLVATSTATITGAINLGGAVTFGGLLGNTTISSNATATLPFTIVRSVIGNGSIALAVFSVSGVSVPVFEFQRNAMVSVVSIVFAASGNWAGTAAVRVKLNDNTTLGWIPILPSAVVTGAAI